MGFSSAKTSQLVVTQALVSGWTGWEGMTQGGSESRAHRMADTVFKGTRHLLPLTQEPAVSKDHCWETADGDSSQKGASVTHWTAAECPLAATARSVTMDMLGFIPLSFPCSALYWGQVKSAVTHREMTNFLLPWKSLAELTKQRHIRK